MCCLESSRCSALPPGAVPIPARPAPSLKPLHALATAGAGYRLQLHSCAAARNAIFFIPVYKSLGFLSTALDDPQGRWDKHFLWCHCAGAQGISWGSLASHKHSFLCFQNLMGMNCCHLLEEASLKSRIISLWCCASADGQSCCS